LILLDTSGLLAALDPREPKHERAARALRDSSAPLSLSPSPFVLAELDHLVLSGLGPGAEADLLEEVARGAYRLERFGPTDIDHARTVVEPYRDLGVGLAGASIVVPASRYGVHDVLTLDERRFRGLRGPDDRPFRLLPADA
jgi:predicted nucleic acid-binding protein